MLYTTGQSSTAPRSSQEEFGSRRCGFYPSYAVPRRHEELIRVGRVPYGSSDPVCGQWPKLYLCCDRCQCFFTRREVVSVCV
jgi:hypothetical protein